MKKFSNLIGLFLMLAMLFNISAPALAAGRQEALYPDETVVLGAYEQDGIKSNGPEDIQWRVLEARGDYALLISQDILDARRYNNQRTEVTWEECTLRKWLNSDFYESAFSEEEQEAILTTTVDNSREQGNNGWRRSGGNETEDKVFLLSYAELRKYFDRDRERICKPTEYATYRGVWTDKNGTSHWWLRSPGATQFYSAYCSYKGNVSSTWNTNDAIGVRPVIRVDLNAVKELSSAVSSETADVSIGTEDYPDFRIEDGVLLDYLGAGGEVTIPNNVKVIGAEAFSGCDNLRSVTIPDGVTRIAAGAFSECRGLTSVTIPDSVAAIEKWAFSYCSSLMDITIPDSVSDIGIGAFAGCSGPTEVTIPESMEVVGNSAFFNCYGLTSVTIPDCVTEIGPYSFSGCIGLKSIIIPDSVTEIGHSAFSYCGSLASVTIPESVTEIEETLFSGCYSLTNVNIPDSVTRIGEGAFADCSSLTSVTIPESVAIIEDEAFCGCSSLTDIYYSGTREERDRIGANMGTDAVVQCS